jgi:hypothetical protein
LDTLLQFLQPDNPLSYIVIVWAVAWKGIALWHAARNRQLIWYIALIVVNTAGILEIIYIIFFQKKDLFVTSRFPWKN